MLHALWWSITGHLLRLSNLLLVARAPVNMVPLLMEDANALLRGVGLIVNIPIPKV